MSLCALRACGILILDFFFYALLFSQALTASRASLLRYATQRNGDDEHLVLGTQDLEFVLRQRGGSGQ